MSATIAELIRNIPSLGSYAGVMTEIETVLEHPNCTLATLGEVIEKDPDLAARLLKLGNSAFFGFPSRLETVSETIGLIGIQQVQDLILASSAIEIFEGISPDLVNMESFWVHSLACGIGARSLAIARQMPRAEKYFIAGLLHDLGRLALFSRAPREAVRVFGLRQSRRMLLREAEMAVLSYDHAQIGEALARHWQYPANLVHAVAFHHQPMAAGVYQLESSLVHLADYLAHAMQMGHSGESFVPPLNPKAWERVGLSTSILDAVMKSIDDQIEVVRETFLRGPGRAAKPAPPKNH